jgi:maltose alpha-D-glucosyltransferase/alpha-amylase
VIEKATGDVWWKNAVIYCVDVATFLDADGDGIGDLPGLTNRIDYLAGIGVSCLWLMPFYPSPRRDDGYDVTDFYGVDSRFGSPGDFVELVRTAQDRGIRVIVDLVPNHTSIDHPWFQAARAGRDASHHDFYVWTDEKPPEKPGDVVFPDKENSNWAWDDAAGQWYLHRFYSHQPDLNVANPQVRDELAQVIGYWLQQGLAGFRVDAVPFLLEPMGMPKGALHDPHELLRELRRYLGRRRGDAILLGEVNLEPPQVREFFGDSDELHMAFDFILNQAMFLALARKQAAPLAEALAARLEIPEDCAWAIFARNHDELSLDKLTDAEREEVFAAFGPDPDVQLYGRGLRKRLATLMGGDQDRIRLVYSLVFSLPGAPVLFYGEEIGMAENLAIEGRGSVRSPMRWSRERHAGFSSAPEGSKLVRPLADDDPANVADQRRDPDSLLSWMERLIRRRRECPEFGWGRPTVLDTGRAAVFAHRCDWADSTVVAVHNLGPRPVTAHLDLGPETLVDLFDHDELVPKRTGRVEIPLGRYGHRWFALRRDRVAP